MTFRITTWNGEFGRSFLGPSTNTICSQWHPVRDSQSATLKLTLMIRHHRNPFGYQPWREKRTFQVHLFMSQPTPDLLNSQPRRLCSRFLKQTLLLCKRPRSSERTFKMTWFLFPAGMSSSAYRSTRKVWHSLSFGRHNT